MICFTKNKREKSLKSVQHQIAEDAFYTWFVQESEVKDSKPIPMSWHAQKYRWTPKHVSAFELPGIGCQLVPKSSKELSHRNYQKTNIFPILHYRTTRTHTPAFHTAI